MREEDSFPLRMKAMGKGHLLIIYNDIEISCKLATLIPTACLVTREYLETETVEEMQATEDCMATGKLHGYNK